MSRARSTGFADWSSAQRRGARRLPRAARRPARARPRHADADRGPGSEEDDPRRARRGARGGRFLPLLCRPGARRTCSRSSCPGRPASATCCGWRGAASGSASRRGISRSPSSSARSSAALAAGNSVVAKPASQTPRDRRLCGRPRPRGRHSRGRAGARRRPAGNGPGADGGCRASPASPSPARPRPPSASPARCSPTTTAPIIPLIAETGGINAMIVDSTALPEQVVQDVVTSAFRSAGQRCSALRLLVLQEDVAERTLEMLAGAMDTLIVGDPADPRTDVGPVIDQPSYDKLMGHREAMQRPLAEDGRRARRGPVRAADPDPHRRDRGSQARMVRAACSTSRPGRPASSPRRCERVNVERLRPDHGPAQPHRPRRRDGRGDRHGRQSLRQPLDDRRDRRLAAVRRRGASRAPAPRPAARIICRASAPSGVTSTDTTSAGGNATLLSLEDVGF